MNAMLKTGACPRTKDKWENLDISVLRWDACKTDYKTADMKEQVRRLATDKNAAHGPVCQTGTPQGTALDDIINKDDFKDYFENLDAAATT